MNFPLIIAACYYNYGTKLILESVYYAHEGISFQSCATD